VKRLVLLILIAAGVTLDYSLAGSAQSDPFLTEFNNAPTSVSCREYQTANSTRFATYQWWLIGFASGANHARSMMKLPMRQFNVAAALQSISDYCLQHPTVPLSDAAVALVGDLSSRP
jgi:hypothetical protein